MDAISFGIGGAVGTIMGIVIMALMVTAKQADEQCALCNECKHERNHGH